VTAGEHTQRSSALVLLEASPSHQSSAGLLAKEMGGLIRGKNEEGGKAKARRAVTKNGGHACTVFKLQSRKLLSWPYLEESS
jgi:hypothetical protein